MIGDSRTAPNLTGSRVSHVAKLQAMVSEFGSSPPRSLRGMRQQLPACSTGRGSLGFGAIGTAGRRESRWHSALSSLRAVGAPRSSIVSRPAIGRSR